MSALGGSVKADYFESATHFARIDPVLAPFPSKLLARFRVRTFGRDTGDVRLEAVFSDYRRVKCYDDRFEVRIGPTDLIDFER